MANTKGLSEPPSKKSNVTKAKVSKATPAKQPVANRASAAKTGSVQKSPLLTYKKLEPKRTEVDLNFDLDTFLKSSTVEKEQVEDVPDELPTTISDLLDEFPELDILHAECSVSPNNDDLIKPPSPEPRPITNILPQPNSNIHLQPSLNVLPQSSPKICPQQSPLINLRASPEIDLQSIPIILPKPTFTISPKYMWSSSEIKQNGNSQKRHLDEDSNNENKSPSNESCNEDYATPRKVLKRLSVKDIHENNVLRNVQLAQASPSHIKQVSQNTCGSSSKSSELNESSPIDNDSDEEDLSEDTDDEELDDTYNVDFDESIFANPDDNINFDINTILDKPRANFSLQGLGEKRMADYFHQRSVTSDCIKSLHVQLQSRPTNSVDKNPTGLKVRLMPHQKRALKWLLWRETQKPSGGILADDMGLGKTIEMISLILSSKNEKKKNAIDTNDDDDSDGEDWGLPTTIKERYDGGTLVVCPASVVKQWDNEVSKCCKSNFMNSFVFHGVNKQRSSKSLSKFDVVVTTYHAVAAEYVNHVQAGKTIDSRLFKINWERVILDEAHYIRNCKTKVCKAVCELTSKHKWVLTGTPIQNKADDFYALLKFLQCKPFDDWVTWKSWVSNESENGNKRLAVLTKALMLRRTKEELIMKNAVPELPEKQSEIIEVKLDIQEKALYHKLLLFSQQFLNEFLNKKKGDAYGCYNRNPSLFEQQIPKKLGKLMKLLMSHSYRVDHTELLVLVLRLRQVCCHPSLAKMMIEPDELDDDERGANESMLSNLHDVLDESDSGDEDDSEDIDERMVRKVLSRSNPVFAEMRLSSKVKAILSKVQEVLNNGEKVVIVSQWTGFLNLIGQFLEKTVPQAKFAKFFGSTDVRERQNIVDRINDSNDDLNTLLLSLTAGGCGINLVGANNLILVDLHWNPQWETQAQDRIYRFGQANNVKIYKFICKDTIEEKIKELQDSKLLVATNVLSKNKCHKLTIEDLKKLFSMDKPVVKNKNPPSAKKAKKAKNSTAVPSSSIPEENEEENEEEVENGENEEGEENVDENADPDLVAL
ncbi:transcription termination factor 2-like isoform X2 [Trichogramma pretiosum]|nr:transcription termination factor 2-like isoform X2 [Trichogramma pretiosum]XP_014237621.1 transcription termination factor 2-like isoform X2 [Trichogramma pretiosum]XP_023319119.1 transcription termination factor 2-like isoform X2 [Trichogramma pretiosum]